MARVYDTRLECGCMLGYGCYMPCIVEYLTPKEMKSKKYQKAIKLHNKCIKEYFDENKKI